MTRTSALYSTSVVALWMCGAIALPTHGLADPPNAVLFDQNDYPNKYPLMSDDFTDGTFTEYDACGADDFAIPSGHRWRINEVDVTGAYDPGPGPATSENVLFYKNDRSLPGTLVAECDNISGSDSQGSFAIKIPETCKVSLKGGKTYWVSVVANISYTCCGRWVWQTRIKEKRNPAAWENPEGGLGTGCRTWSTIASCYQNSDIGPDFMFALKGRDIIGRALGMVKNHHGGP